MHQTNIAFTSKKVQRNAKRTIFAIQMIYKIIANLFGRRPIQLL
ncbi:hypothetical protein HMPREF9151_00927 [Hoylesella saccharolytica F0055]|uniref:Uncharacterized protein n=1 Tax=Hoylesella saccharolytica F0055 TaxID=1127699 RepID=L1NFH8_9BACT|nr:hypothetical protein HMPREF9151_00927 [Hoylesella saccharolytica F0055]